MEEKVVVKKKALKEKRVSRMRTYKSRTVYVVDPGKKERTLMCIVKILKTLLMFIETKIQNLKKRRIAKKMNGNGKDKL